MPEVILHGRLWGEEGKIFYPRALALPWREALVQVYGGYLNVVANAAPVLAHALVPLEVVPWITTSIGLVFQCCPAILVACSRDAWIRPVWVRVAALLLIATAPLVEEVWLQTLHSQFHLALCCALILAFDLPGRWLAAFACLLLVLAPLCGLAAAALLPLFLLRALLDWSAGRLLQFAALATGAILQLGLFYTHTADRSYGIGPVILLCVVYIKQIIVPFAGRYLADDASQAVQAQLARGAVPWLAVCVTLGSFAAVTVGLVRRRLAAAFWLFLAACITAFIAYFGAIDGGVDLMIIGNEGRYTFLPEVLAALALLGIAAGGHRSERWVARALVAWLLVVGFIDLDDASAVMKHGPVWLDEVAAWRHDASHSIAIWPDGWFMRLDGS